MTYVKKKRDTEQIIITIVKPPRMEREKVELISTVAAQS
jgi:hypothetical protein